MKKFICTTRIEIRAKSKEEAEIEIIDKMDDHDICWDIEEEEK